MNLYKLSILVFILSGVLYAQPKNSVRNNFHFEPGNTTGFGSSLSCNLNAKCDVFANFNNLLPAIFKINNYATGYLINNLLNDGRLLGITKIHVFPNGVDADDTTSLTFIFNYEFAGCDNQVDEPAGISVTVNVRVLTKDHESDRVLFEILTPSGGFPSNLSFQLLGWDVKSDVIQYDPIYLFGHPSGDVKKGTIISVSYASDEVIEGDVSQGALEYGVSGSPALNREGRVKGDITGGQLYGCDIVPEAYAIINTLFEDWDILQPFLDPNNSGLKVCDARITPLPIELLSFTAEIVDNKIKLEWKTATEVQNSGFDIERRKADKNDWTKLGFVQGHGNSSSPNNYYFIDFPEGTGKYYYRLKQTDFNGIFVYSPQINITTFSPSKLTLAQNYPNPFNPTTSIEYSVPGKSFISLKVFDILGREKASLINEEKESGSYKIEFNAAGLTTGAYFYKLQSGSSVQTRKMIVLK